MGKKKLDPVLACLNYFRDAPLEAAKTALVVAKETVSYRIGLEHPEQALPLRKRRRARSEEPLDNLTGEPAR